MYKIKTALLGATGIVGQAFASILVNHKSFEPSELIASEKNHNKNYLDVVKWQLPFEPNQKLITFKLKKLNIKGLKQKGIKIIFSALPSDVAKDVEQELIDNGFFVFSNSSAFRYKKNVPILIPEVNPESISLIENQGYPKKGFIITNSNCITSGLVMALKPLLKFNIKEINVSTYQAISGAGYPGIPSLDINNNVIPFIKGEEEKIIKETKKILNINSKIYPTAIRVNIPFGHIESVWIEFKEGIEKKDIIRKWNNFGSSNLNLPSMPEQPLIYKEKNDFPNTKLSFFGYPPGMQVFVGRLRKTGNKFGFILLVNNIIRGAAGGSVLNAEFFLNKYSGDEKWKKGL